MKTDYKKNTFNINNLLLDDITIPLLSKKLPSSIIKYSEFQKGFKGKKCSTPIGDVKVNPFYAFSHLTQNTNNQNRFRFIGAFADILKNPLFIIKDKYFDKKLEKEIDTLVFYKPYQISGKIYHLANFLVKNAQGYSQKTFFNITSQTKLKKLFENKNGSLVYSDPKIDILFNSEQFKLSRGATSTIIHDKEIKVNPLGEKHLNKILKEHQGYLVGVDKNIEESLLGVDVCKKVFKNN